MEPSLKISREQLISVLKRAKVGSPHQRHPERFHQITAEFNVSPKMLTINLKSDNSYKVILFIFTITRKIVNKI